MLKLFGIEIERKTDILAAAAFLLSTGSILFQIALFFRGPEVIREDLDSFTLYFEKGTLPDRSESLLLNIITADIYMNKGTPGYDDVIREEYVTLSAGEWSVKLVPNQDVYSWSEGEKFHVKHKGPWIPTRVEAGHAVYRETRYVPSPDPQIIYSDPASAIASYIKQKDFIAILEQQIHSPSPYIRLSRHAVTFGGSSMKDSCYVPAYYARHYLLGQRNGRFWTHVTCARRTSLINSILSSMRKFWIARF